MGYVQIMGNMEREADGENRAWVFAIVTRKISKIGDGRAQCFRTSRLACPPAREVLLGTGLAQLVGGRPGLIPAGNRSRRGGSGELRAASRGRSSAREELCSKSSYHGEVSLVDRCFGCCLPPRYPGKRSGLRRLVSGIGDEQTGFPLHLRHPPLLGGGC